jgi:hypothetical protein
MNRTLLAALLLFAACGGTVQTSTSDAGTDAPSPTPVVCGSMTCGASELCVVSCTGTPFYCDAPDGGACGAGEHLTTSCAHGPGANLDGGGCSNVVYSYACQPRAAGDTSYTCPSLGSGPITAGVATCCSD